MSENEFLKRHKNRHKEGFIYTLVFFAIVGIFKLINYVYHMIIN